MDRDKRIEAHKNLIPSAHGERLLQLTEELLVLVLKKLDEEKSKQNRLDRLESTIEPPLEEEPPSLPVYENLKGITVVEINSKDLFELYFDADGVADFMNRCNE
jgi:hypothetical protein